MKRVIVLILITAGFVLSLIPNTADARTHYRYNSRYNSRIYSNYYHRNSPVFGMRSPYVRTRRPLNVPVTTPRYSYRPTRQIIYMGPQPMPFYNPWDVMVQPVYQSAYQPIYTSMISPYPQSSIRLIQPMPPTIIERERIIVDQQPATRSVAPASSITDDNAYTPSISTDNATDISEQLAIAQQLFRERKYKEAAQAFHNVSGLKPGDAEVKMGQSLSLLAVGDYQGSGASLRQALSLNPVWFEKPIDPTEYYGENKDIQAHLITINRFVDKNPNHVEAKLTLAYVCYICGNLNDAAEHLADILDMNPGDIETMSLLGNLAAKQSK